MTNRETMQQALEALDVVKLQYTQNRHINDAITAIKEALAQPVQRKPLTDDVLVPMEILEAAANSLDSFCGNLGWGDADLQNMDNLFAVIEQHKAAHGIKEKK
jgi:hypothetical protein